MIRLGNLPFKILKNTLIADIIYRLKGIVTMSSIKKKSVQGTYIANDLKQILEEEASKREIAPATLASQILEKGIKQIEKKKEGR